jgi:hypothetical protein
MTVGRTTAHRVSVGGVAARRLTAGRAAFILGIVLLSSYGYFYQAGGWNQNSRFAVVRSILERHTLRIDAYSLHTGDKALWRGHYYSDKPPGTSLMVLPPVAMARGLSRLAGVDPESFPGIAWTSYVATVTSAGVCTAIAGLLVFFLLLRWGFSTRAALFAASAYGLTGPAWSYATLFMSHGVTAGCLMAAYCAADALRDRQAPGVNAGDTRNNRSDRSHRARNGVILGLASGWAVLSEFQAVIPVAVIVGTAALGSARLDRNDPGGRQRAGGDFKRMVIAVALPALACALVLFAYNTMAFDSPLHLGYASEEGFEQLRKGFFGITYPAWWRVREILVGDYRGLLPVFPLLALTPFGLLRLAADRRHRTAALVALFVGVYYFLLNASYFYWEGGWSYAPRQLTPGLPFMTLGLAPLWDLGRLPARPAISDRPLAITDQPSATSFSPLTAAVRLFLLAGWVWGAGVTLVAVSTNPQPPSSFKAPMRELLWPAFRDGDLSLNHQTFVHGGASPDQMRGNQIPHAAWNLGEIAGLHGWASLVPLGLVWVAALLALLV